MHLFRIVFMWRSLAVHVILLSMITAAIALPIGTDTTEPGKEQEIVARSGEAGSSSAYGQREFVKILPKPTQPKSKQAIRPRPKPRRPQQQPTGPKKPRTHDSKARAIPIEYIIGVIIEDGKKMIELEEDGEVMYIEKEAEEVDPNSNWVVALIPVEDLNREDSWTVTGFQTIRDSTDSVTRWKRKVKPGKLNALNGVSVRMYAGNLILEVARVTMTENTRSHQLANFMRKNVQEHHIDKLPNVPSIYQFLLLFREVESDEELKPLIKFSEGWAMSESSSFGKTFKQMVNKMGTGAREVLSETDKWERELYERIKSGQVKLDESLKCHNRDILEDLWNEDLPFWAHSANQDIDDAQYNDYEWALDGTSDPLGHR
ncbi:hypothetical protein FB446DRAFT_746454 [Lentinula raphanica]|nr:hypothetical protein FB446DRAFT_746454 [Lentinula raphanica]